MLNIKLRAKFKAEKLFWDRIRFVLKQLSNQDCRRYLGHTLTFIMNSRILQLAICVHLANNIFWKCLPNSSGEPIWIDSIMTGANWHWCTCTLSPNPRISPTGSLSMLTSSSISKYAILEHRLHIVPEGGAHIAISRCAIEGSPIGTIGNWVLGLYRWYSFLRSLCAMVHHVLDGFSLRPTCSCWRCDIQVKL